MIVTSPVPTKVTTFSLIVAIVLSLLIYVIGSPELETADKVKGPSVARRSEIDGNVIVCSVV